eukprot:1195006-Prorocentrum_minimum.AAC.5
MVCTGATGAQTTHDYPIQSYAVTEHRQTIWHVLQGSVHIRFSRRSGDRENDRSCIPYPRPPSSPPPATPPVGSPIFGWVHGVAVLVTVFTLCATT